MKCEKCGQENVVSAAFCASCGVPFVAAEPDSLPPTANPTQFAAEITRSPRRKRGSALRVGIMVVALLALLAGGVKGYQYWFGMPVLESVIPDGSIGYTCGDARWLWANTADVRAEPKVAEGLRELEGKLGFSLEKDVMPWAGNVAVAMVDVRGANPMVAVYIQVKDQRRFYDTVQRVRSESERRSGLQWSEDKYSDVPLRRAMFSTGVGPTFAVSTFWLKGWIVIGIGNGTTERVIDTWQKRTPSIAQNAHWAKALSSVSPDAIAWFGFDGAAMQKVGTSNGLPMPVMHVSDTISVGSVTPKPDGFRVDSLNIPTSPESIKLYQDLAAKLKPISPEVYARLPDGTFATLVVSKPDVWTTLYKKILTDATVEPQQKRAMDEGLREIAPLEAAVQRITGDAGGAVAWREGQGFGGVVIADVGTEDAAAQAATDITQFARTHNGVVTQSDNGSRFTLTVPANHEPQFQVSPTWESSGTFITFATHPAWLQPGTSPDRPTIPAEAKGANMIAQGDFRPLTAFVADVTKTARPDEQSMAMGVASDTHLSSAHWVSWSTTESDGTTRGVAEISGWQWREAEKALVLRIHDEIAKHNP